MILQKPAVPLGFLPSIKTDIFLSVYVRKEKPRKLAYKEQGQIHQTFQQLRNIQYLHRCFDIVQINLRNMFSVQNVDLIL